MNEAAILVTQEERKKVSQFDLIRSIEKSLLGPERKKPLIDGGRKENRFLSRSRPRLGFFCFKTRRPGAQSFRCFQRPSGRIYSELPLDEKHLYSKAQHFLDKISVALGGYLAEKMIFSDITTGASDDLRHAMEIARALVMSYGMSGNNRPGETWGGRSEPMCAGKSFMAEKIIRTKWPRK